MSDLERLSLTDLLELALERRVIDRYCVDRVTVRFWQGNLRLQFERAEASAFLCKLLRGFRSASAAPDWDVA